MEIIMAIIIEMTPEMMMKMKRISPQQRATASLTSAHLVLPLPDLSYIRTPPPVQHPRAVERQHCRQGDLQPRAWRTPTKEAEGGHNQHHGPDQRRPDEDQDQEEPVHGDLQ
eukprot:763564-Hanusia_phi.AAC.1